MPLITKIEKQKKDRSRYNLYIDNDFYCGLYDDTILKYGIAAGDEIKLEEVEKIRLFDEYIFSKKVSFDYLAYRIRTVAEIRKKLHSKKISGETIEKVIAHLKELGLLNDSEFARQLIAEKIKNKPQGRRMLEKKLYEKGISRDTSAEILNSMLDDSTESALAEKLYSKLKPKLNELEPVDARKKIYETLARKGFEYETINKIILKFNAEKAE